MSLNRSTAIAKLWHLGNLSWKLEPVQKDIYNAYYESKEKLNTVLASRRLGKSYVLCVLAIEQCLKYPNSLVKYLAPTQKNVRTIINPNIAKILEDCPLDLLPEYKKNDGFYKFPNGSEIQLAGTDAGNAEALRGGDSHLCIIDEAGFCDDLKYIIQSILIPTTLLTKGKLILSSTPPKSPGHEFADYVERAEERKSLVKKTIYDGLGSRITMEIIAEIREELGGEDSQDFRRECLCEMARDGESTVVPEFDKDLEEEIIKSWTRPPHYDRYVAGDIGLKDWSVFLFGYYDYKEAKLIIEDEVVLKGKGTAAENKIGSDVIANAIKAKEKELYYNDLSREIKPHYLRVTDNSLFFVNDLKNMHDLDFLPTLKDDKDAALNNMKVLLKQGRIIINPKCHVLINHLKFATWNKTRTSYLRKDGHHYDAVDALIYFCRAINLNKNPYPSSWGLSAGDNWFDMGASSEMGISKDALAFKALFKHRR